jgi:NDP-sugar pyrophosphorylase family protein
MEPTLVILAAGVGSRYGGLKQLEPVGPGGESLMEYSVFDAARSGFGRIVLVVRPETEAEFRRTIGARVADRLPVSYVHQTLDALPPGFEAPTDRVKPWGTGQAVLVAEPEVDGPFAVVNADDFYGADAYAVLGRFLDRDAVADPPTFAMAAFEVGPTMSESGPVSRGLCRVDADGFLEKIVEVLELWKHGDSGLYLDADGEGRTVDPDEPVSMNMWGFSPAIFDELRRAFAEFLDSFIETEGAEFLLPDVVQRMIREQRARVRVLRHGSRWCGITYPEDRAAAEGMIADLVSQGAYPPRLWE